MHDLSACISIVSSVMRGDMITQHGILYVVPQHLAAVRTLFAVRLNSSDILDDFHLRGRRGGLLSSSSFRLEQWRRRRGSRDWTSN